MSDAPIIEAKGLNLWYGRTTRSRIFPSPSPPRDHGVHRAVRLRQIDLPAHARPHERPHSQCEDHRRGGLQRREHLRAERRCDLAAQPHRHGLSKGQPLPHEHLRQHRLRSPDARRPQPREARRDRGALAALRRHLGRGEGPAEKERARPLRRTAAAALHRPGAGRRAGGAAHGRVHERARPHLHLKDRRPGRASSKSATPSSW